MKQPTSNQAITVALTGASGVVYGLRLIESLIKADEHLYVMVSSPAQIVIATESDFVLPGRPKAMQQLLTERYGAAPGQLEVFGSEQWSAPVASGSGAPRAMVVCPCTCATLSAIAVGASRTLMERAADVMLKEARKLILVPREMPLSAIHLEHMLKLARLGVTIMPASPGFYHRPTTLDDLIDFVVARILDHLGVKHQLLLPWGEKESADNPPLSC